MVVVVVVVWQWQQELKANREFLLCDWHYVECFICFISFHPHHKVIEKMYPFPLLFRWGTESKRDCVVCWEHTAGHRWSSKAVCYSTFSLLLSTVCALRCSLSIHFSPYSNGSRMWLWLMLCPKVTIPCLWEISPHVKHRSTAKMQIFLLSRQMNLCWVWKMMTHSCWKKTTLWKQLESVRKNVCGASMVCGASLHGGPGWLYLDSLLQSKCYSWCPEHRLIIIQRRVRMMYIQIISLRAVVICSPNVLNANSSFRKVCSEFCWGLF